MVSSLLLLFKEPAVIGALSGFGSLVLAEVFRRWLTSPDRKTNDAKTIRDELWAALGVQNDRIDLQQERINSLEREVSEWKEKYFHLYEANIALLKEKALTDAHNIRLADENTTLRVMVVDLGGTPPPKVEI